MAKLSNINGKFAVEDTGAIRFSDQTGTTGQILKSNGNSAPTWVDPNTVGTGPWLPLAGGVVSGPTTFQSSLTVGGALTGLTSSFVSTVAGTTVVSSEGAYSSSASVKLYEAKRAGGAVAGDWSYDDATTDMSLGTSTAHSFSLKTANTPRLTINNSGNATFSGNVDIIKTTSDVAGELRIGGILASDNLPFGKINFANTAAANSQTNDVLAYIAGEKTGSSNRGELTFATSNNSAPVERLRIDSSGIVNIGTATGTQPSYFHSYLNVQNNASTSDNASITITAGSSGYAGLHFGDSDNGRIGQVAYNNSNNSLLFTANNSTRMTIDSSGNVGIGTDSPDGKLHVQATNSGVIIDTSVAYTPEIKASGVLSDLKLSSVGNGGNLVLNCESTSASIIQFTNGGSERMRITSGGNVGIGTTSTLQKLCVSDSSGVTRVLIENTGNAAAGAGLQFLVKNGATIVGQSTTRTDNAGNYSIFTGTSTETERMRIDQYGNIKTVDGANFYNKSDGWYGAISYNGSLRGYIGSDRQIFAGGSEANMGYMATGDSVFGAGSAERMRISSDGKVIVYQNGNVSGFYLDGGNTRLYANGGGGTNYRGIECNSSGAWSWGETGSSNYFAKKVGIGKSTPYSILDINGVLSIGPASEDPNFTVTSTDVSTVAGGSLELVQGFVGTTAAGDTIVFTYAAQSWKSFQYEYCISAAYGLSKGGGGGYNNTGTSPYYYVTTNQGSNVNVTSVTATSGGSSNQHVVVTITGNFGIHPCVSFKYTQSGGDGAPRADRATLAFNS